MPGLYVPTGGTTWPPEFFWFSAVVLFALSGVAMILFAKPFESFGYRHSEWDPNGPQSARFYRVVGTIWVLIAVVMAVPLIVIWAHSTGP